ncbi:FIG00553794: hypothetical protein [Cronobacter malonaticus 681]|nr:FIG00553794: hypothetical protein [Cronobacter malonaticus 681]
MTLALRLGRTLHELKQTMTASELRIPALLVEHIWCLVNGAPMV